MLILGMGREAGRSQWHPPRLPLFITAPFLQYRLTFARRSKNGESYRFLSPRSVTSIASTFTSCPCLTSTCCRNVWNPGITTSIL